MVFIRYRQSILKKTFDFLFSNLNSRLGMKTLRVNKRYRPTVKREKGGELVGRVLMTILHDIVYRERRVIASHLKCKEQCLIINCYLQTLNV